MGGWGWDLKVEYMTWRSSCGVEHWSLGIGLKPADIGTDLPANEKRQLINDAKVAFYQKTTVEIGKWITGTVAWSPFARVDVLLLPGPAILKPDLCHPLWQAGDLSYSFEVLPIRVGIDLKIGLQYLNLFLCESRSHPLGLLLWLRLRLTTLS